MMLGLDLELVWYTNISFCSPVPFRETQTVMFKKNYFYFFCGRAALEWCCINNVFNNVFFPCPISLIQRSFSVLGAAVTLIPDFIPTLTHEMKWSQRVQAPLTYMSDFQFELQSHLLICMTIWHRLFWRHSELRNLKANDKSIMTLKRKNQKQF